MTDDVQNVDVAIIGAGVVGLAIARALADPEKDVVAFEQHASFGQETSSRNSEVIHAGIYYPPGSLKAQLCVSGRKKLYAFLDEHAVPYRKIGKYIVAKDASEIATVRLLEARARENGVDDLRFLGADALRAAEPSVQGVAALWSPSTGIFDTHDYMVSLEREAKKRGASFLYNAQIISCEKSAAGYHLTYLDQNGELIPFCARVVINAAGLAADTVAAHLGVNIQARGYRIHYCKGEYFRMKETAANLVSHLIYPVPDRASLGLHLTPDLGGGLRIGPNVIYTAGRRKDYTVNAVHRDQFFAGAHELVPMLRPDDIVPDTAGYRPKLQGPDDAVRDFVIKHEIDAGLPGIINLIGIESPGLTASLAIADYVKGLLTLWKKQEAR